MVRTPIRNALAAVSTVAALLAAPAASAFNYTYIEGGYTSIDLDYGDDESGFRLGGSFDIAPQVALIAEYNDWDDLAQLSIGAIYHAPLQKDLDFFAGGTFERIDYDIDDDTGFGLRAGLRWQVPNLPIQLIPEVRYLDVLDDSLTSFRVTGLFTIAPRVDLVAGLQTGDDDRLELGARYNF